MFARVVFCVALACGTAGGAQNVSEELVDRLFAAAQFEENIANLREVTLADWQETGVSTLDAGDDPVWERALIDGTAPELLAADFRRGFLSVPFPADSMEIAISELQTPFGQRLTRIGLDISELLAGAETLAEDFAAAELTNDPRVIAADQVLDLRGSIETHFAFMRAAEEAFYLGFNGQSLDEASLNSVIEEDLGEYMAEWEGYFEAIRGDVILSYRQMFFLVTHGFTPAEVDAWVARAEQPWAQAFEAAFQAGYREAYRHSMYRQGQAVAAWDGPVDSDG